MAWKPSIVLGSADRSSVLSLRSSLRSSTSRILISVLVFYVAAFFYCKYTYNRDPTSFFFDPIQGYARRYSLEREVQALAFIDAANASSSSFKRQPIPSLCIGIATIARSNKQYVRSTIGSLLEGLSEDQRSEIHLSVLIAHTDPYVHPIFQEPWLKSVSNEVLEYLVSDDEMSRLKLWEDEHHYRNKSMFDYAYLLEKCRRTDALWVAMIEDDVLAMERWYERAMAALEAIKNETDPFSYLYLRMFYTENLFGWNSEEWVRYLGVSMFFLSLMATFLFGSRACSGRLQRHLSTFTIVVLCCIALPAFITLYFMAGRISMHPLKPGIHKMPKYGCCSQGFIFSSEIVPRVIERAHQAFDEDLYVDMMLERWADAENLTRYALVPSLLQHVGAKSSKGWGYNEGAETTWNFGFEQHVPLVHD